MNRKWYAVRTKPNKEEIARLNYRQQGFEVYLPTLIRKIKHARQIREVPRPLFPSYLFLHLNQEEILSSAIDNTKGAIGLIRFQDGFPAIPESVIYDLRKKEDSNGHIALKHFTRELIPGQEVQVTQSSITGLPAFFQEMRGKDRALILLDFLNRQTKTIVPLEALKVV